VLAPSFDEDALALLGKKKNLRLVRVTSVGAGREPREVRVLLDGFLAQDPDTLPVAGEEWRVVTEKKPTNEEIADARFAWSVAKHVRSNAIVLARDRTTVGIGAGQMSRVDSTLLAIEKARRAGRETKGSVLASDGFFPFPDSIAQAREAGIALVVQPGGSIRDDKVLEEANRSGIGMIVTGVRHFRH
jgi:phosphoribosylaminoimidazolecarboxamide formyltransferase/IMP cyclohydrolase